MHSFRFSFAERQREREAAQRHQSIRQRQHDHDHQHAVDQRLVLLEVLQEFKQDGQRKRTDHRAADIFQSAEEAEQHVVNAMFDRKASVSMYGVIASWPSPLRVRWADWAAAIFPCSRRAFIRKALRSNIAFTTCCSASSADWNMSAAR